MKIFIKPTDILKRGLWDTYVYYVLDGEKEAENLLKKDDEVELSERDAYVMGLLKIMETPNLIYRFNDYLIHFLTVKSVKSGDDIYSKKKSLETAIDNFLKKFPSYWTPDAQYRHSLQDLYVYIDEVKNKINKLEISKITIQNITYEVYSSNAIKKTLNFNNY